MAKKIQDTIRSRESGCGTRPARVAVRRERVCVSSLRLRQLDQRTRFFEDGGGFRNVRTFPTGFTAYLIQLSELRQVLVIEIEILAASLFRLGRVVALHRRHSLPCEVRRL